jgi:misacylated tRNA(Ala) deacylase
MTDELFREDARLADCNAGVVEITPEGLILDRTVFYPLGGGQAGDVGTITLTDGRAGDTAVAVVVAITDTRKHKLPDGTFSGGIVHVVAPDHVALLDSMKPGDAVTARIDKARRERLMRFHTTTHLLCALVPHAVNGCSITPDYARLDFHMNEPLDKDVLTEGIARLVAQAAPVTHRWIDEAELDANPGLVRSMSVQPPRGTGRVRVIDIAGVDLQPCGGTHVANTTEIGRVVVTKIEKKSAMTRRVVLGFAD